MTRYLRGCDGLLERDRGTCLLGEPPVLHPLEQHQDGDAHRARAVRHLASQSETTGASRSDLDNHDVWNARRDRGPRLARISSAAHLDIERHRECEFGTKVLVIAYEK